MANLVCDTCAAAGRTTHPVTVHYVNVRTGKRRLWAACAHCDSTARWPNFTKVSPPS